MIQLFDYFRSSACFRVRIALRLKGLSYEKHTVHLINNGGEQFSDFYSSIHPQHLVPALQEDDKIIPQSLAIIEYLEEKYPSPPLLPSDIHQRALIRAFALNIACEIHPLNIPRVLNYLKNEFNLSDEQKQTWYAHWITEGFDALEKQLLQHKLSGKFCVGDTPGLGDIFLIPQVYNANRFNCDITAYPHILSIFHNCQEHPAFIDAWPKESPT